METRDKVLVLIVLGWIAAAVWFKISTDKASDEMSDIREMISGQIQTVNKEFRDNLYDLELNFIGREEHLQAAQDSISKNRSFTKKVKGNLKRKIENVQGDLESFERNTQSNFEDTEAKIEKNKSDLSSFKRSTRRNMNDHGRDITTLQKDVETIQEKIKKLKESAFKKED
jgi:chromosome segregation ATPase|tara:strand:- start:832 stop:1344 length:513 start_codon:yes stop_codon:yes gene_type:complete